MPMALDTIWLVVGLQFVIMAGVFVAKRTTELKMTSHFDRKMSLLADRLQWEQQTRLKCERIAEYMVLARSLSEDDPPKRYERANQLAFELALWLPTSTYRKMAQALVGNRTDEDSEFTALLSLRKTMLRENAGDLGPDNLLFHSPGIGRRSEHQTPKNTEVDEIIEPL